jgi:cytochrome c-type biogenesis protein
VSTGSVVFAAGAGIATFLSPCALPLVPGYVGYYVNASESTGRQTGGIVVRGLAAGAGALLTLGVLAGLAVAAGRPITTRLSLLEPLVGVALVGLGVAALIGWSPSHTVPLPERRADTAGFALFGAGYAGASAGCVLPVFLGVVLQAVTLPPTVAAVVVGAYAAGVAVPLLLVTLAVGTGLDLTTGRLVGQGVRLERLAGVVLIAAGVGQLLVAAFPSAVPAPF